jgi:hypothetical protein
MRLKSWYMVAVMGAAILAISATAGAQGKVEVTAGGDGTGQVILPMETFQKVTGWRPDQKPGEEPGTFTMSWDEVQKLLNINVPNMGQSKVRVTWQEFKALLEWSIQERDKAKTLPPPVDWAITSADYVGDLMKDGAVFTATFKISVLKEKEWKVIPLLPATVALQEVTLPKGASLRTSNNMYEMLTTETGPMEAKLKFAVAVREQAGSNTLMFGRVPSSTCLVDVKLAQTGVDIQVAGAQSVVKKEEGGATRVAAALPAAQPVQLSWERAIPEAEKVPAKLYSETQTLVAVGDGILVCRERVNYSILHTGVRVLELSVPTGVSILDVKGERVRDWRVAADKLIVALSSEVLGNYALFITYEKPTPAGPAAAPAAKGAAPKAAEPTTALSLPIVRAEGVVREKGHIGVVALANVELSSAKIDGATSIDVRELPPEMLAMTSQPILLAYRYVADKFDIPLAIKKHESVNVLVTIVDSAVLTTMETIDGRRITKAIYNVRNNRQQFLRLEMPKGAEIWSASVSGRAVPPGKDEQGRILLPLERSEGASSGLAAFPVELVYVETLADGAKPAASGVLHIDLPRASEPVQHMMVNLYLPKEGKYTRGWSGEPAIDGALTVVKEFSKLTGAVGTPPVDAQGAAVALQQMAQQQAAASVTAAGATPIKVNLPLDGQLFRLEKVLVLGEPLSIDVNYSGWEKK